MEKSNVNDYYLDALIAEYNATREASLAREAIVQTLNTIIFTVIAIAFASFPLIIEKELFIILPVISMLLISLMFSKQAHSRFIYQLIEYENILQKNIQSFIKSLEKDKTQQPPLIDKLWNWQSFHLGKREYITIGRKQKIKLRKGLFYGGVSLITPFLAIGFSLSILLYKNIGSFSLYEHFLFWTSILYSFYLIGTIAIPKILSDNKKK